MPPLAKKLKKAIQESVGEDEIKGESVVSAQLQKKLDRKAKNYKRPERGVVLIRHLPHGFFEDQLRKYFEQFGYVTRLRLARSRTTGNAKGFAFIEFAVPEVAKVAAETMHNYLMFKKIVRAHYIPPEEQKYNYFKSKVKQVTTPLGKNIYVSGKTKLARYKVKQNNRWDQFNYEKRTINSIKKLNKLKKKYADLGLDFDDITISPKLLPAKVNENDETEKESEKVKTQKPATSANKKEIKQLLEKTLEDESTSEDEDYVPNISELKEMSSSEDETDENVLNKTGSIFDDTFVESSDDDEEDYVLPVKKNLSKSIKSQKADRVEKIIRRNPLSGGIQKHKRKPLKSIKQKSTNVAKDKMKNIAAKEIVKTNKIRKLKKSDIKNKKQK